MSEPQTGTAAAHEAGKKFLFVWLAPGISRLNATIFCYAAFSTVGLLTFINTGTALVLNANLGSVGEFNWGGMASTLFWVDPAEDLVVIFMTQLMPSGTFNFRGQLQSIIYSSIEA